MRILTLCLLILFVNLGVDRGQGQTDVLEVVYEGRQIQDLYWSADSQRLVFSVETASSSVQPTDGSWVTLDTTSNQIQETDTWALYPDFSPSEEERFEVSVHRNQPSFVYQSSNDNYIVYAPFQAELEIPTPMALGNRETGNAHIESGLILDPFTGPDEFSVIWREDSQAFVVKVNSTSEGDGYYFYVNGYDQNVDNASFTEIESVTVSDRMFTVKEIFDISTDGHFLLLSAGEIDKETSQLSDNRLLLYDIENPLETVVIGVQLTPITSSFCATNEQLVLYLADDGLYEYDLKTMTRHQLLTYSTENIVDAKFAPNGMWLAIQDGDASDIFSSTVYAGNLTEGQFSESLCFSDGDKPS